MSRFQSSVFLYLFFFVVCGLGVNGCINETDSKILPLDEGYKPDHPIEFSHDIHVSKGIDCKYCHNSANDGKSEGIPAENVCLKCHKEQKGKFVE
jgi:hypothetical protein